MHPFLNFHIRIQRKSALLQYRDPFDGNNRVIGVVKVVSRIRAYIFPSFYPA